MLEYKTLIPNTFGVESYCDTLIEFRNVEELLSYCPLVAEARKDGRLLVIGRGSNLLPVGDFPGVVLRSRIMGKQVREEGDSVMLTCGSGETVDDIIEWCVVNGYHGMENLSLIPGEVGASAVQNIGAYGSEAKDVIASLRALDIETGSVVEISNAQCRYSYRRSRFKEDWKNRYIILNVTYALSKTFRPVLDYGNIRTTLECRGVKEITARILRDIIIDIRRNKLPDWEKEGNAGSFFMNPKVSREKFLSIASEYPDIPHYTIDAEHEKIPAGWMVERCGWKGKTVGNAGVYDKQALVLVNRGGATGIEIQNLCRLIQKDVTDRFGIEIVPEVNIIGGN